MSLHWASLSSISWECWAGDTERSWILLAVWGRCICQRGAQVRAAVHLTGRLDVFQKVDWCRTVNDRVHQNASKCRVCTAHDKRPSSQWSWRNAAALWSCDLRPRTSRAEAFWTRSGASVDCGRPACYYKTAPCKVSPGEYLPVEIRPTETFYREIISPGDFLLIKLSPVDGWIIRPHYKTSAYPIINSLPLWKCLPFPNTFIFAAAHTLQGVL